MARMIRGVRLVRIHLHRVAVRIVLRMTPGDAASRLSPATYLQAFGLQGVGSRGAMDVLSVLGVLEIGDR